MIMKSKLISNARTLFITISTFFKSTFS